MNFANRNPSALKRIGRALCGILAMLLIFCIPAHAKSVKIPDPNAEELEKAERLAAQYTVLLLDLAMERLRTPKDFVDVVLADRSPKERAFILKKMKAGVPLVYRTSPTTIAVDGLINRVELDFKNLAKKEVFINGQKWTVHLDRDLESEWPVWDRRFDNLNKSKATSRVIEHLLESVILKADAGPKVTSSRAALEALRKAVQKAAQEAEAAKKAETAKAEQLNKRVADLEKKFAELSNKASTLSVAAPPAAPLKAKLVMGAVKGFAAGAAVAVTGIGLELIRDFVKAKACARLQLENPECVNAQLAMKNAEELLNAASPPLDAGAHEQLALKAAMLFETTDMDCPKQLPDDPVSLKVRFKKTDVTVIASIQYNKDGKADSGKLTSPDNPNLIMATYQFNTAGGLIEVCIPKTQKELAREKSEIAEGKGSLVSSERCVNEKQGDSAELEEHSILVQRINLRTSECASTKAERLERQRSSPPSPDRGVDTPKETGRGS